MRIVNNIIGSLRVLQKDSRGNGKLRGRLGRRGKLLSAGAAAAAAFIFNLEDVFFYDGKKTAGALGNADSAKIAIELAGPAFNALFDI